MIVIDERDLAVEKQIGAYLAQMFQWSRIEWAPVGEKSYDLMYWGPYGGIGWCEIKADWASQQTQNAFFEIKNTGLRIDSGLVSTRANVWAHYFPGRGRILCVDPKALLWWLNVHHKGTPRFEIRLSSEHSGDQNAQGYIVPCSVLCERAWIRQIPERDALCLTR